MNLIRQIIETERKQETWEKEQVACQKRIKEFKERENEI